MAKRNKKVSYNPIRDISEDWGLDSRNQLPYSGESVQAFIKQTLNRKIGYRATSERKESDGYFHTRNFADEASYKLWLANPIENSSLVLQDEILPDTHEQGVSYVVGLYTTSNQSMIVSTDGTVKLKIKFTSQMYNSITQATEDTGESGTLTVERRTDNAGIWKKVGSMSIISVPYNSDQYADVDISKLLEIGNQQIRVLVRGDNSGETTKYLSFISIVKTSLSLSFATQWQTPISGPSLQLAYNILGAVAKTIHIRIYGIDGTKFREKEFAIGNSIYIETPKTFDFFDSNSDTVKVLEHGIHKIEAWLTVDGGDIVTDKVYSQVMVNTDPNNDKTYVVINNVMPKVDNWTETTMFDYSVYNPKANNTTLNFNITDSKGTTSYLKFTASNIANGVIQHFNNMFEVESVAKTLNAYIHVTGDSSEDIANVMSFVIDNSTNFAATPDAAFVLNPKMRSNNESNPSTIINNSNGNVINSTFKNFAFTNDGWIEDENHVKCLRVPAGRELTIDYEAFSDFIGTSQNTSSATIEFDFKTKYISDENLPIIRMCSYGGDENPLGFELRPLEAVFMTGSKKVRRDQDIMFQEGVRTHVAVNIIYNIASTGMNYIRIFINGIINREIEYLASDTFVGFVDGVQTSQGIRIGSTGADIDIYGIRIYKKKLSSTNVMQDYVAALPSAAQKIAFRDTNDILSDDGTILFSKAYEKYNCLVWTGPVPSYLAKSSIPRGGTLQIHIKGDPHHSGTINNMSIKGQGSSSKGYWKWNHQYGMNSDSVFTPDEGEIIPGAYPLTADVPAAKKLVTKINWASSMQSHKMGETEAYNVLWKKIVGGNSITKTEGFEKCRSAIIEKPFLYFVKETPDSEPVFYSFATFGPGKADKPTFGYDKKKFPNLLMLEGSDNGKPLTECRVPWMDDEVTYSAEEEAYIYNGEVSWDYDMGNQDRLPKFKEALNYVFQHSVRVAPHEGNYTALVNDVAADKNLQYWITEGEGAYKRYDLFRWDYITKSWVYSSIHKTSGSYDKFNINEQCGNTASGLDWQATNQLFIAARIKEVRENFSKYFNVKDTLFSMIEMKKIGASDNRCKNIYPYLDPITQLICWFQDDVDTILLTDNVGRKNKPYYVEEHDLGPTGNNYWNGEANNLFNLIEAAYPDELRDMMKTILKTMAELEGSPTKFMDKYFFSVQRYFPAVAYNEVARLLYEEASKAMQNGKYSNATAPITQSLGDQLQAEQQWWKMREIYMSSYAGYGEFSVRGNNSLMFRSIKEIAGNNPTYSFRLTPAIWLYVQGGVGQTMFYGIGKTRPQRVKAGETYILDGMTADGNTDVFINGANYYKSFGPFGDKALGEAFQLFGERLTEFVVESTGNVTEFRPNSITVNCPVLKTLKLKDVRTLSGTLDIQNTNVLQQFDASGTNFNSVLFAPTPTLVNINMPNTLTDLTLKGLTNIIDSKLVLDSYSSLSKIEIVNCPKLNVFNIINTAYQAGAPLNNVIAYGIDWNVSDVGLIEKLANTKAGLSGKITLRENITVNTSLKLKLVKAWGNIDSSNNQLKVRYNSQNLTSIRITGPSYCNRVGKYSYNIAGTPVNGNNLIQVRWSITRNMWAIINSETGELMVVKTGESTDSPLPTAIITCEVTKSDLSVISATLKVNFYTKKVALGDIVYADGSYSDEYDPSKTAIGVCFYINPDDETDRRIISLADIGNGKDVWGLHTDIDNGVPGLRLTDKPTYDCYNVPILEDITLEGTKYVTDANYRGGAAVDSQGFKLFSENTAVGQLKKKQITLLEGLGNYHTGEYIPYGLYNTLLIIRHRDTILSDSGVNLPIPKAGSLSEFASLTQNIFDIVTKNKYAYRQYYYPAASMCYAYEPSVKPGEVLNDKFKAHKWWLPSAGEMARICYYKLQGYDYSNNQAIFAKAYNAGVLTLPSEWAWTSTEASALGAWLVYFATGNVYIFNYKYSSFSIRAVTSF